MSQSVVGSQFVNWRKERVPTPIRVTPNDVLSRHSLFLTGSSFQLVSSGNQLITLFCLLYNVSWDLIIISSPVTFFNLTNGSERVSRTLHLRGMNPTL